MIHFSAEDPTGLSSHARLVVVVAAGRNDPPQVHLPGATYVDEPCDSRTGRVGLLAPQHPPPLSQQCRRIVSVSRIQAYEDETLAVEGVYIEDPDAEEAGPGAQVDVEVEAQHGSLRFGTSLSKPPGILVSAPENKQRRDRLLLIRGSLTSVNRALARLTYTPDADWNGSDEVMVRVNDRGFTGSGGAHSDSRAIPVDVAAVNDPPLLLVTAAGVAGAGKTGPPPPIEMWEDSRITLHNVTAYDADVNPKELHGQILDVSSGTPYEEYRADPSGGQFQVTVTVENGRVFFPWTAGLIFSPATSDGDISTENRDHTMMALNAGAKFDTLSDSGYGLAPNGTADFEDTTVQWWRRARFTGRLYDCNRAISSMTYWPNINWHGVDIVHVRVVESHSGEDAVIRPFPSAAEVSMFVRVGAVNDAPVVTPPLPRWRPTLRTGDLLSPVATRGHRVSVLEDHDLSLPGFIVRDIDLVDDGRANAFITVAVTCRHGTASVTWHGSRAGVGPGDSRHPLEGNSLGVDLTGLLFLDEATGEWGLRNEGMGTGSATFTFRASLADANAALQSLTFRAMENFFGSGAWVRVEAIDEGSSQRDTDYQVKSAWNTAADTEHLRASGFASVPITVLAVNDAPSIQLPFSEDGQFILQLDEEEERRLTGARWLGSLAASVHASAYFPLRKGMELWKSLGVFPGKDAGRWGKMSEMEWKEVLVADLNEGLGHGSARHFAAWGGYLFFQVSSGRPRRGPS